MLRAQRENRKIQESKVQVSDIRDQKSISIPDSDRSMAENGSNRAVEITENIYDPANKPIPVPHVRPLSLDSLRLSVYYRF